LDMEGETKKAGFGSESENMFDLAETGEGMLQKLSDIGRVSVDFVEYVFIICIINGIHWRCNHATHTA